MSSSQVEIEFLLEDDGAPATMADEVVNGLRSQPKTIPSKYFYDERGSELFERITELPEYYPTRTEQALLEQHAAEIATRVAPVELFELGSGSAKKTRILIEALLAAGTLERYTTLEVSEEIARSSARRTAEEFPGLDVRAVVGDFELHLGRLAGGGRRLVAFLGSTLGNFERPAAVSFLRGVSGMLGDGGRFLLGTDLVKDPAVLHAAYNDARGVTAEFNLNILNVVNRHLDGDFDPAAFEHVAFYDENRERVEMHLRSKRAQRVRLGAVDLEVSFAEGERMRTEISQKYTRRSIESLLGEGRLSLGPWFTDPREWFALSLSEPV